MQKMKIGVWIVDEYRPEEGGGFSLYEKTIRLIDEYSFSDEIEICFIGFRPYVAADFNKQYICLDFISTWFPILKKIYAASNQSVRFLRLTYCYLLRNIPFLRRELHKILQKNKVDLIFYPVQAFKQIDDFPFITSNWDVGHLSSFPFPEVSSKKELAYRRKWYAEEIHKAVMIFAESNTGKAELQQYLNLNPDRIEIVPLFPGKVVEMDVPEERQQQLLADKGLIRNKYLFYPAQFWAHKNHYNLLVAFKAFLLEHPDFKLVLSGADKGNKAHLLTVTAALNIQEQVEFIGFIDHEMLCTLYKNALAMVMPTYLGPTNMPLLEARMLNCPVLCSDLPGHREMMQNGALFFNPHEPNSIKETMTQIVRESERVALLEKAAQVREISPFNHRDAIQAMDAHFVKSKTIRLCWGR